MAPLLRKQSFRPLQDGSRNCSVKNHDTPENLTLDNSSVFKFIKYSERILRFCWNHFLVRNCLYFKTERMCNKKRSNCIAFAFLF